MKRVWLVNQYAMPPKLESRLRTIKFAHYLTLLGFDATVFGSSIMHNMDKNLIDDGSPYKEVSYGDIHFVHINCRPYHRTIGLNRIISSIQFTNRFIKYSRLFGKPDVIVQTSLVPFGNRISGYVKSLGCKYIVECLDLWPQELVDVGVLKSSNPILPFLFRLEKQQYAAADEMVFSFEGCKEYLKEHKWNTEQGGPIDLKHVHYINNGVDLKDFDYYKANYKLDDPDLTEEGKKRIVYLGSIRKANGLMNLIKAAEFFKDDTTVVFLIYGDGDDRQPLEDYCKNKNITSVRFKQKWIDPAYVPYVLSSAYLNILNYQPGGFGHYGGSQSKSFQYMASGKPICCNLDMMYNPITKYRIGISREFASAEEYASAIQSLLDIPLKDYNAMCTRARQAASDYDYPILTNKLVELF